jgi:predicted amidophosphoribosyltransferase
MRICPDCKNPVSDEAIFCDYCGLRLKTTQPQKEKTPDLLNKLLPGVCSACGHKNLPGETFCQNCGVQLPPVQSMPPPPPKQFHSSSTNETSKGTSTLDDGEKPNIQTLTYCLECGFEISDKDKYCQNCGAELSFLRMDTQPRSNVEETVIDSEDNPPPVESTLKGAPSNATIDGPCPSCGYINDPDDLFCQVCGLQLRVENHETKNDVYEPGNPRAELLISTGSHQHLFKSEASEICPNCGAKIIDSEDPFCQNCGQQLSSSVEPSNSSYETLALHPETKAIPGFGDNNVSQSNLTEIRGKLVLVPSEREIPLMGGKSELLLGRSDPVSGIFPDIDLEAYGGDRSGVSRRHARLIIEDSQLYIEDLNSTNYTFLNKQKLDARKRYPIKNGDEIRCGGVVFHYYQT